MRVKRILVLANSFRMHPNRCIAGREVTSDGGQISVGGWIRPISTHGEGELSFRDRVLTKGTEPKVMDLIEVPLSGSANDPFQPENWFTTGERSWKDVTKHHLRPSLDLLVEEPEDLWMGMEAGRSDRVSHTTLQASPPQQSLYLVRPTGLRFQLYSQIWEDKTKHRQRALFNYHGVDYDISITDPVFLEKHCEDIPAPDEPRREFTLPCGDNVYLCLSLTRVYEGHHYKIVATILGARNE